MPSKKELEREKQALQKLGLTEQEIQEVMKADREIEQGKQLFELSAEQKKAEQKAKATGKTVYNLTKPREKKIDADKQFLISVLHEAIKENGGLVMDIPNPERELVFTYANKKYKIVMSMPRS